MLLLSCSNDMEEIKKMIDYKSLPLQQAKNIEILRTDSGKVVLKVAAPEMERYTQLEQNPYEIYNKGITVTTYHNFPNVESYLTCNFAKHKIDQKLWEAKGNVVAVNEDNDTIRTELVYWDQNTKKIYSDKYVKIHTKNEIFFGIGFVADEDFKRWKITNLKGSIYLDD